MLLDEIIGLLGDENGSLTDALLKTKILLHQIGRKELVQWVNNELNGYADDSDVPSYRVIPSHVVGNVSNVAWRAESQPLPIQHLDKEYQAHLEKAELRQSLAVVEKLASSKGAFIRRIPLEANHLFDKGLGNGFRTENIWCETSRMDIVNVLVQVRSRLLDFMLELRDNVGQSATETELREKSTTFDAQSMFNNAIFGPNTTILIGHQSSITATQTANGRELAEAVIKLITEVERLLPGSGLPPSVQKDSKAALEELRQAASEDMPDVGRLSRGLKALQRIMEHAAGHIVATGVLTLVAQILSRAAH
jgi:hypothetical protein